MRRGRWAALALIVMAGWQLEQGLQVQPPPAPDAMHQALPQPAGLSDAEGSFATLAPMSLQSAAPGQALQSHGLQPAEPSWDQRLSDARSEQLRLQADVALSAAQRATAMQAHLQQHFSAAERQQVEALLRLMPH